MEYKASSVVYQKLNSSVVGIIKTYLKNYYDSDNNIIHLQISSTGKRLFLRAYTESEKHKVSTYCINSVHEVEETNLIAMKIDKLILVVLEDEVKDMLK